MNVKGTNLIYLWVDNLHCLFSHVYLISYLVLNGDSLLLSYHLVLLIIDSSYILLKLIHYLTLYKHSLTSIINDNDCFILKSI